jgi:peptide/nickel transport system permease protein
MRRVGFYLLTAWVALTVAFFLPRLVPGSPIAGAIARATASGSCNVACVHAIEAQLGYGVHTSLWTQYVQYWGNLLHLDLGVSWSQGDQPVSALLLAYLPWTVGLLGVATVISFLLGTAAGAGIGWLRGSRLDWLLPGATFFQAVPYFFLALVVVLLFGQTGRFLRWFPSLGGYDPYATSPGWSPDYIGSLLAHAVLPAVTVVLASTAGFIMAMRNQMVSVMDEDFVLLARAKGLPGRRVLWYAARNALLPSVSNFSVAISLVVAGQLLVEIVFSYPGIGYHLFRAISDLDYTLVQGIFVVVTLVVLTANLLADFIYVFIDPRARQTA